MTVEGGPKHVTTSRQAAVRGEEQLAEALAIIATTDRLLVALDFDGVLAPLTDDPWASRALPESASAIAKLATIPNTTVAFVSGRDVANLERVAEPPENAVLVGSHGVELRFGDGRSEVVLEPAEQRRLDELGATFDAIVEGLEGAFVERKPVGVGLHTRLVRDHEAAEAARERAIAAADTPGAPVTVRAGRDIVELSVRDATKGDGIHHLAEYVDATGVIFAGDDVTDEDGFAVLGPNDIGIKVGEGETAAGYRVDDAHRVARVLTALAEARAAYAAR